jgi:hypothetical protein
MTSEVYLHFHLGRYQSNVGVVSDVSTSNRCIAGRNEASCGKPNVKFPWKLILTQDEINEVAESIKVKFQLSCEQYKALEKSAQWFMGAHSKRTTRSLKGELVDTGKLESLHAILHVNGVFGSGKTRLLVAICSFVDTLMQKHDAECDTSYIKKRRLVGSSIRILLVSLTDTAVDDVLQKLLNVNFSAIARCGAHSDIARLVQSFHVQPSILMEGDKVARFPTNCYKLNRVCIHVRRWWRGVGMYIYYSFLLLSFFFGNRSCEDDDSCRGGADLAPSGHATGRQIYKQARVVGITCATAKMILGKGPEVVSNFGTFPIVLFEDSPRFIASVGLDCCRLAKCSAVVSVGDPKQQVGTLFVNDEPATRGGKDHTSGIGVTFFGHTEGCDATTITLQTQQRCQCYLGNVTNTLFYDNAVKNTRDGKSNIAMLPGLPGFIIVDIPGSEEEQCFTGGFKNAVEAHSIAETAHLLVTKANISPSSICVVVLFSEQIRMVRVVVCLQSDSCCFRIVLVLQPTRQVIKAMREIWPSGDEADDITVTTVNHCQGTEFDIVLLATTRTHSENTRDDPILHTEQSIIVALTRARQHLFVFGHCKTLESSYLWRQIIHFPGTPQEKLTCSREDMKNVMAEVDILMLKAAKKRKETAGAAGDFTMIATNKATDTNYSNRGKWIEITAENKRIVDAAEAAYIKEWESFERDKARPPTTDVEQLVERGQFTRTTTERETNANYGYIGKVVRFLAMETDGEDALNAEWDAATARQRAEWDAAEESVNLPAQRLSLDDLVNSD